MNAYAANGRLARYASAAIAMIAAHAQTTNVTARPASTAAKTTILAPKIRRYTKPKTTSPKNAGHRRATQ